jgi:hypothetical protein
VRGSLVLQCLGHSTAALRDGTRRLDVEVADGESSQQKTARIGFLACHRVGPRDGFSRPCPPAQSPRLHGNTQGLVTCARVPRRRSLLPCSAHRGAKVGRRGHGGSRHDPAVKSSSCVIIPAFGHGCKPSDSVPAGVHLGLLLFGCAIEFVHVFAGRGHALSIFPNCSNHFGINFLDGVQSKDV